MAFSVVGTQQWGLAGPQAQDGHCEKSFFIASPNEKIFFMKEENIFLTCYEFKFLETQDVLLSGVSQKLLRAAPHRASEQTLIQFPGREDRLVYDSPGELGEITPGSKVRCLPACCSWKAPYLNIFIGKFWTCPAVTSAGLLRSRIIQPHHTRISSICYLPERQTSKNY